MKSLLADVVADFRRCWTKLFLTDAFYKAIAFMLLTPLVAVLFRIFVGWSGSAVLADQDMLYFLVEPLGWVCLIIVAALWLGIIALEQAALIAIVATPEGKRTSVIGALRFASVHAWQVSRVTARLVISVLLVSAPFLAIAAAVYFSLLSEFDINYYLKEKPPVFMVAVGIGGVLGAMWGAILLRLLSGWFFALPLVLFENIRPRDALSESRRRATGHRKTILAAIVVWGVATIVLSMLATTLVVQFGRLVVPRASGSLSLLVVVIGSCLVLWTLVNVAVSLISTTTFASLLFHLYRRLGCPGEVDISKLKISDSNATGTRLQITKKRVLIGSVVGILVAATVGTLTIRSIQLNDDVEIMAHRGSSHVAPENTMASVRQAIIDKADWVEIDVQETADGEVVVFHDSDFMKLAGVNLKIWDATMSDLSEIDIGSRFDPKFKDERVPTLDEVLAECKGNIGVNIELKYYGHDEQLEQRVIDIVEARGMVENVIYMSLKLDAVKKMKSLRPNARVGLLMSVSAGNLKNIEADFLAVNAGFVDRGFVRRSHANNKGVYVWTVNDVVTMSTMVGRGVDGLITDKPALAREVLTARSQWSPAERLILELAETFGVVSEFDTSEDG